MSLTYTEIYQNKIKYKNKLSEDNKENIPTNRKIISLIKKFPVKQRKSFKTNKNNKPRGIQSKSVELIQKYRKANNKKKTTPKQKFENNSKNKNLDKNIKNNNKNINKKNDIKNNNNGLEINKFYKTEINKDNLTNDIKADLKNKFISKIIKTNNNIKNHHQNQQKNNKEEKDNYNFNKVNKFDNIHKSNNNSIETYFDIFRLRQHSASFKNKIKNIYLNKYYSNNDLYKFFNSNENNKNNRYQNVKSYSDYSRKKSKTYYKAIKLKEQLEYNLKNNINKPMYSSCNNFYVKNKYNIKNNKEEKDKNKNLIKEMNHHFCDGKEKKPKVIKKFLTHNGTLNCDDINKEVKNKNNLRTKSFGFFPKNKENAKGEENMADNLLINKFNSEMYQMKFKRTVNLNNKSLNLIVQDNPKLNSLLRKIPSSRDNKNKSLDLMNYILQIRNKNDNVKYVTNVEYKSDINLGIFPPNEWEPITTLKYQIK